jgi:replicative DNA helicase
MSAPRRNVHRDDRFTDFTFPAETRAQWHRVERAVIGAVIVGAGGDVMASARALLPTPEHFDDVGHATVWRALLALADRAEVVDFATLSQELTTRNCLNAVGGLSYLGDLTDDVVTLAHIATHARLVAEAHAIRRSVRVSLRVIDAGARGDFPKVREAFETARDVLSGMAEQTTLARIDDLVTRQLDRLAAIHEDPAARAKPGLPWHLPTLNEWTDGLHPGQLIVVAGRPGSGKSAFLEQLAVHIARHRSESGAVVYWSLEMVHDEWAERAVACEAGVDLDIVRGRRQPGPGVFDTLLRAANALCGLPVLVDDASRQTPGSIRASAERVKREHGLAAIFVDYLQLTEADLPSTGRSADTRAEEVAQMTRAFKVMAKDLGVPVILGAQLNRESEKGGKSARPRLANLRESGAVEQDANLVLLLHVEGENHGETAESHYKDITVIVEKSRGSRTGDVATYFTGPFQRFTERAQESAEEAIAAVTQGRPGRTARATRGGGYTAEPDEAPGVPFGELQ